MNQRLKLDMENLLREYELYEKPQTQKQQDIVAAAEKLFGQRGFTETPTAEIARQAGVTEKTLFKYFPTKQDLMRRVLLPLILKTMIPAQLQQVQAVLGGDHDTLEDALMAVALDRLAVVRKHGHGVRLILGELFRNERFRERFAALWTEHVWHNLLVVLNRFKSRGQIREDVDVAVAGRMLVLTIGGFVINHQFFAKGGDQDVESLKSMIRILVRGMVPV